MIEQGRSLKSIGIALAVLVADATAGNGQTDAKAQFDHAATCRVHTQLLPMIAKKDPVSQAAAKTIYDYWIKTSDKRGLEAGHKPEALEFQYLLIPIKPDEALIDRCVKEALENGALK